jgi:hypothetical protein
MSTRRFLAVLALLGVTLACNLPEGKPTPTAIGEGKFKTLVNRVTVDPSSGSGSFTPEVTYDAGPSQATDAEKIICYYVTPDGASMGIEYFIPKGSGLRTETLTFNVSTAGGAHGHV